MLFTFYAALSALLICGLALKVINARKSNGIKYGDGGVDELIIARSTHSNAIETMLIALVLLFGLEVNGGDLWIIHLLGISLLVGRVLHAKGMLSDNLTIRKIGMQITVFVIVSLAVFNLIYAPYSKFLPV